MKCEHCGYDAPERAVICPECGEILPRPKKAEEEETEKAAVQKKTAPDADSFSIAVPAAPGRTCPTCGKPVPDGNRFCTCCGAKVDEETPAAPAAPSPVLENAAPAASAAERICPTCGNPVPPQNKFCTSCGTPVGE